MSFNWKTDGIFLKPLIVEKDYTNQNLNNSRDKTILVTCFYSSNGSVICANPINDILMEQLFNRHKQGWSNHFKTFCVPEIILSSPDSWLN